MAFAFLAIASAAFSQAIRDRNVIPVAVNLNEVMRMTISNGGNIEFVFNSINDYKRGISGEQLANLDNPADADVTSVANPASTGANGDVNNMYRTDFIVASSVGWQVQYGAENATFIGTDNPANTMALDNVGLRLVNNGTHAMEGTGTAGGAGTTAASELYSNITDNTNSVTALQAYPQVLVGNNKGTNSNAGDATDNSFTVYWRCGTTENSDAAALNETPMQALTILNQGDIVPDRYVTNIVFELQRDL